MKSGIIGSSCQHTQNVLSYLIVSLRWYRDVPNAGTDLARWRCAAVSQRAWRRGSTASGLARISHRGRCIGAPVLRKSCWLNGLSQGQGESRCRHSVAALFGFARVDGRSVVGVFDGGKITSDAGALLLAAIGRNNQKIDPPALLVRAYRARRFAYRQRAKSVPALGTSRYHLNDTMRYDNTFWVC